MSRTMLDYICDFSSWIILSLHDDGVLRSSDLELDHDVSIWDDLDDNQKLEAIRYVRENKNGEDFSNSGYCQAIHQATAYFLVEFFKSQETKNFFDDLDFMADDMPVRFLE